MKNNKLFNQYPNNKSIKDVIIQNKALSSRNSCASYALVCVNYWYNN